MTALLIFDFVDGVALIWLLCLGGSGLAAKVPVRSLAVTKRVDERRFREGAESGVGLRGLRGARASLLSCTDLEDESPLIVFEFLDAG